MKKMCPTLRAAMQHCSEVHIWDCIIYLTPNQTYELDAVIQITKLTGSIIIWGESNTIKPKASTSSSFSFLKIELTAANDFGLEMYDINIAGFGTQNSKNSALILKNIKNLLLTNVTFIYNIGNYGGALYMSNIDIINITDSKFLHNNGYNGGAMYITGTTSTTTIENSNFTDNSATLHGGIYVLHVKVE
jgi:predicted outer membrane repeat protein